VHAGDLVVAAVLAEAAAGGVDRRRRVASFGQPADRLVRGVRVVGRDIEEVARVERVSPASLAPGELGPPP